MKYPELIKLLAQKYSLPISLQEETEKLSLHINGRSVILQMSADRNTFFIYLDLYKISSEPSASFYKRILSANLLGRETNGYFIGYDPSTDSLYLMDKIDEEIPSIEELEKKIHKLLFAGSHLNEKILIWEAKSLQETTKSSSISYPMQKFKV